MAQAKPDGVQRYTIICRRCERPVIAREAWAGQEARCPHCQSVIRVPPPSTDGRPVQSLAVSLTPRRCFNFACPACECLLEGHTGMCGQVAACPTCAARFKIPYVRGNSGRVEKAKLIEGAAEAPVPTHAYGASGIEAPTIVRSESGESIIQCPRCNAHNAIDADTCGACAAPFTMDAAPTVGKMRQHNKAVSAVTLGVIGLFLFPIGIPAALAVWFGLRSAVFEPTGRRSNLGLVGLSLGILSLIGAGVFWYIRLKP